AVVTRPPSSTSSVSRDPWDPAGTEVAGGDGGHRRGRRSRAGTEVAGGDGGGARRRSGDRADACHGPPHQRQTRRRGEEGRRPRAARGDENGAAGPRH